MADKIKTPPTEEKSVKIGIYFYLHSETFIREDLGMEGVTRAVDSNEIQGRED